MLRLPLWHSVRGALLVTFTISCVVIGCRARNQEADDSAQVASEAVDVPTFCKDVAPIIFQHCAGCHRPQGSAPFQLLDYDDVDKRAQQIVSVIDSGFMPPWLPSHGSFEFRGAPTLSANDVDVLKKWIHHGKLLGDARHLPDRPSFQNGWQLGEPDLVVEMRGAYSLAADGSDVYRNFVIPLDVGSKKYVRAFEFKPNNPKVVHHAFLLMDKTGESRRLDATDEAEGYDGMDTLGGAKSPDGHLIAWLPGRRAIVSPDEMPWTLEPASDLVLQVHMQPSGRAEDVSAKVGFYFTEQPPTKFPLKLSLFSAVIDIAAGDNNYVVTDSLTLPVDVSALAVTAHAHYLGKRLEALATFPDGTQHHLLNIPKWDFNWQGVYEYDAPPVLPRGTRLEMRFQYDNSAANPLNPNAPPKRVRYGLNTTDEMAEVWLQLLPRNLGDRQRLRQSFQRKVAERLLTHSDYIMSERPDDIESIIRRSKALMMLDRKADALRKMQEAVRRFPQKAMLHQVLGEMQMTYFDSASSAVSSFQQALSLDPTLVKPHVHLGGIYYKMQRLSDAAKHFSEVTAKSPDYGNALSHLGMISSSNGDVATGTRYFERCLKIDPTNKVYIANYAASLTNLGVYYAESGQYAKAIKCFEQCVQLDPSNEVYVRHLEHARTLGDREAQN